MEMVGACLAREKAELRDGGSAAGTPPLKRSQQVMTSGQVVAKPCQVCGLARRSRGKFPRRIVPVREVPAERISGN